MSEKTAKLWRMVLFSFSILITGTLVNGDSLEEDREVLLRLKEFMQKHNRINQGRYSEWNQLTINPCQWYGVSCNGSRVTSIILSENSIAGEIFTGFSELTALSHLDLSKNTLSGGIPQDLGQCHSLKHLNLSHNILDGKLQLSGLNQLEVLDLSVNRIRDDIEVSFPAICNKLIAANLSANNFTGKIDKCFDGCLNLRYLDLSANTLSGDIWVGAVRLTEFSVSKNTLGGTLSPSMFTQNCSLKLLDLSENEFGGGVPGEISNCRNLFILNLFGNNFTGKIPMEIGSISNLVALFLGRNSFSREIPEPLLNLNKLTFLDMSWNNFGGDVQEIFGKFKQVKYLVLHGNSYTGGIISSEILNLQNISRMDLSYNNFSGPLPVEISKMPSLEFLVLAYNQFNGTIPAEFGNLAHLQALDLSFNNLTGSIPSSLGNLKSLLWLMLANNNLMGPIPPELGNCSSLLWLNLANNRLTGKIPSELTNIGRNATPTFEFNRENDWIIVGSSECLAMKRWIPQVYPPFSFIYTNLARKSCRTTWGQLFKGIGTYPLCSTPGSAARTTQISGYVQLGGNFLSGGLPPEIGQMKNFSMFYLGANELYGELFPEIGNLPPLIVFNISMNKFSGAIPEEIGNANCLRNLDFSYNNFSGTFPLSFNRLTELSKFNISYNPFLSGRIPSAGQMATFDKESYLGNPLLDLPGFIEDSSDKPYTIPIEKPEIEHEKTEKLTDSTAYWVFVVLTAVFFHIVSFYLSYTKLSL